MGEILVFHESTFDSKSCRENPPVTNNDFFDDLNNDSFWLEKNFEFLPPPDPNEHIILEKFSLSQVNLQPIHGTRLAFIVYQHNHEEINAHSIF